MMPLDWRATHCGTKIKFVRMPIEKGADLRFISEHGFEAGLRSAIP